MIRAVLVDDEPPARRKLRHMLKGDADITIVAEAASGAEAVEALNHFQPDLAFVDVQLPDCTGFDVIESLDNRDHVHIIFVTAHDDFALKAFEVHALDYLLKPVEPGRFAQAVNRARRAIEARSTNHLSNRLDELVASLRPANSYIRRLLIQENERSLFLDVDGIDWIESARNYACIHSGTRTYITRSSLESLALKLDPSAFRRINRSEIVNIDRISEVRSWFHGDQKLLLNDGTELNWSRRYRTGSLEELERA
jgi:two-component system LytT family response regulator